MSWGTNVLVGQSGGPTAVINSSLAGVYEAAKALGAAHVYGMEYGIQGLLQGKIVDLDDRLDDKMEIELLKRGRLRAPMALSRCFWPTTPTARWIFT